ncbi:unnamed protein product [Taenia asiatica]|uniref:Uncharacterized protein n=1 Tax=Taenia asiatica TaxID=60517 RepID=A0A0R3WGA7_TAEAS|nr:unnamed protein product [Taenia asiatica]
MDRNVPPENRISSRIADHLPSDPPPIILTEEILFWAFYNCCREATQLVAVKKLSAAGGPTQFAQSRRIPRPTATVANTTSKLPVVSSMLSNGPSFGVFQPTPVGRPKSEVNDSTVPPVVTAPTSVVTAAASSSTGTSLIDSITTATTTVPPSSS